MFCKIARGGIPAHKVHEDAGALAFLDIRPLTKGHALVIPKKHYARLEDMPAHEAAQLMEVVHRLSSRLCQAVGAPASTIAINNGREAGQEVAHVHVHVVPRTAGDSGGPIHALFSRRPTVSPEELTALAQKVAASR